MNFTQHPTAIVHPDAKIGSGSVIGPFCIIGAGAEIGSECVLEAFNVIDESILGDNVKLLPQAVICGKAIIGNGLILGQGARVEGANIGQNCRIWHQAHIGKTAELGNGVMIGKDCSIGPAVKIGNNCKVQNGNSLYEGIVLEDGAFIGPHCAFTNDRSPRAVDDRSKEEWLEHTLLKQNCALGAGTVVRCGITIGIGSRTGAGTLVVKDIPDGQLWVSKALPAEQMTA